MIIIQNVDLLPTVLNQKKTCEIRAGRNFEFIVSHLRDRVFAFKDITSIKTDLYRTELILL